MWSRRILCEQNPSSCLMILLIDVGLILKSEAVFLISILLPRSILFSTIFLTPEVLKDLDLPLLGWSSTVPSL
uniref:Ovule protein n=1 Tax=Heterorhabditis bacteriophora TaxID=37862 RepID=A0A1I7X487_HETBA